MPRYSRGYAGTVGCMAFSDPDLAQVFTLAMAEKAGLSKHQVIRRVRAGHWLRFAPGVYCLADSWQNGDRRTQHLIRAQAACLAGPDGRCISHASAAAWHELPLPFDETSVWLTGPPSGGTQYRSGVRVLAAALDQSDVESAGPIRVTSPARTVADCLRILSLADALTVGDAAVVKYLYLREEVQEVLDRCEGWPFVLRARERLALVDRRRETPLESASFAEMLEGGVPLPEPQVQISDDRGRFVGRVDFWWEEHAVAGEADGLVKYGLLVDDDPVKARKALVEEKRREDRLRAMGVHVVRWGLAELRKPNWAQWLRNELQHGDASRFRGTTYMRHLR